jgi:hypothetical protein
VFKMNLDSLLIDISKNFLVRIVKGAPTFYSVPRFKRLFNEEMSQTRSAYPKSTDSVRELVNLGKIIPYSLGGVIIGGTPLAMAVGYGTDASSEHDLLVLAATGTVLAVSNLASYAHEKKRSVHKSAPTPL